jgi:hypothetical protein
MDQNNSPDNKSKMNSIFTFTIENFIDLEESIIQSSEFSIGDTKWFVRVLPRKIEDNIEYISVFLYLTESQRYVNEVQYKLSTINNKNLLIYTNDVELKKYNVGGVVLTSIYLIAIYILRIALLMIICRNWLIITNTAILYSL